MLYLGHVPFTFHIRNTKGPWLVFPKSRPPFPVLYKASLGANLPEEGLVVSGVLKES